MQLSVVIPSLNGLTLLEESLPFLFTALQSVSSSEVIVVDNDSIDGTAQFLKEQYPEVAYLKLLKNQGFTGAVNAGVRRAKGEYILMLNNDCLLSADCITKLLKTLQDKPIVATQPSINKPTDEVESIGYVVDLTVGKAEVLTRFQAKDWEQPQQPFQTQKLFGLSGTCLLIRSEVFHQVGMFDESFHSYLEDIDLCFRLAKKGYAFIPTPAAECVHHHMSTSKKMGNYKQKHDLINWIRIIVKNYPLSFIVMHFRTLAIERMRNLSGLLKKK
jgi:GT2 family glycosyltransferase